MEQFIAVKRILEINSEVDSFCNWSEEELDEFLDLDVEDVYDLLIEQGMEEFFDEEKEYAINRVSYNLDL